VYIEKHIKTQVDPTDQALRCWNTRRSISADWSQPTSHYAVGFPDMISDNKLQTFN